ncbi:hypothetical protein CDD80_1712 [Ophiocordyceps camponoti-rufipedis]|uniref:PH-response regulator protein palI/RIM9 n=1 Tax=Ophiocordyceps camponoti-rufipedis TaxID=2004952 RepID=A0A2C5Z882_9HYPO|nr:hypothetical protein CDD80_1712 [Ophiocordyceps camponoti-rufipedis]
MFRPSTPLSVLLLAAFVLLLATTLSVPILKTIPLASFNDVNFGALGFCKGDQCTLTLGLDTAALLDNEKQAFAVPTSTRNAISFALVLHPIAAALALAISIMAIASHLRPLSHSTRYLLILFVLIFLTFLASLAAFLVDILLFLPHLQFGAFLTLTATIVLGISGIASCTMRRAVLSRLAHRRRVEDNAEMSGENYHLDSISKPSFTSSTEPTLPVVGTVMSAVDSKPQFAAFEYSSKANMAGDMSPSSPGPPQYLASSNMYGDRPPVRAGAMGPLRGGGGMPTRGRGGFGSPLGRGGYPVATRGFGSPPPSRGGFGSPPPGRGGYSSPGRGGAVGLPERVSPHEGGPGPPRAAIGARGGRGGAQGFGNAARQYDASPVTFAPARTGWNNDAASQDGDDFDVYSLYENGPYDDGEPMPRPRSPAESDRSGFTSISQRGVNPRWRGKAPPPRRPSNASLVPRGLAPQKPLRRPDVLLDNPDFSLGGGGGGARRGGMGLTPGSAYPTTAF